MKKLGTTDKADAAADLKKLPLEETIAFNNALSQKGLKAKHVSGENYVKVLNLKTALRNALKVIEEGYTELAEEFGMTQVGPGQYTHPKQDKDAQLSFSKKVNDMGKKWRSPAIELNFIPEEELKEFCKEQDVDVSAILFEYLLKPEEKK